MSIATEQDVRDLFVDLDVNGDGLLSLSDLRAAVQDAVGGLDAARHAPKPHVRPLGPRTLRTRMTHRQ
jgi:Ca2+-binding EF-hand superfamily protein